MEHFICTGGCDGVSDTPDVCEDMNCKNNGMEFEECHCGSEKNHVSEEDMDADSDDEDSL